MHANLLRILRPLGAVFFGAMLLAACGGDDDDLDDRLDIADPKVRFVHAVPAGPAVSLYRNDAKQADVTGANYLGASRYFDVATGTATWAVKTETNPTVDLGSLSFDSKRGDKYTIVALPGATVVDLLLIEDPYNKGLVSDKARVRVVNAAFNAPSIDVYLTAPTVDINTVSPTFGLVEYKSSNPGSGADSNEFNGGSYLLRITATGSKTVIFSKTVTLDNNADWLLAPIADEGIGAVTPNDVRVLLVRGDDQNSLPATELLTD